MQEQDRALGELIDAGASDPLAGEPADGAATATMDHLLCGARYELWPVRGVREQARLLPAGATVPIACFPAQGIEPTVALAVELAGAGYRPVPHLSARTIPSRGAVRTALARLDDAGVTEAFVIAGDVERPAGPYSTAAALLTDLVELDGGELTRTVGVAGYPEGHPSIDDAALWAALRAKQALGARFVVTQMCFDPDAILGWIGEAREHGVQLPVHVGVAGSAERRHLVAIARQTGVGTSLRFLTGHAGLVARLFRPGGYNPRHLVDALRPHLGRDRGPAGFNVFTLNRVDRLARVLAG